MGDIVEEVRRHLGQRIAEFRTCGERLSPLEMYRRMDSIRQLASAHGLAAMEEFAASSAQLALLPGHRMAARHCLEHMDAALAARSPAERVAVLAAVAVRLG